MRILRITLRNIASIAGTHTVDFTTGPLLRTGLYVICGATGSGKSTLLDALCLALYERTPRLELAPAKSNLEVYGEIIAHRDPGNLLRRGTWEGFAEVAFIGVDGAPYTSRWSIRRARNKPDGKLQGAEMVLYSGDVREGNGTPLQAGKRTEVKPLIEAKIGLSYEQFTRAVLLSQNDFAAFLKAVDKDRAEILQELTGTSRFEEISIQVFERHRQEQQRVREIEARLQGNRPLDPEARQLVEGTLSGAQTEFQAAETAVKLRENHASWFVELRKLTAAKSEGATALARAETARQAASTRRQTLQHLTEVDRDARPLAEAEARTRRESAEAQTALVHATEAEASSSKSVLEAEQKLAGAEETSARAGAASEQAKPHLKIARDLDSQLVPLQERLAAVLRDCAEAETALQALSFRRDDLQRRQTTALAEEAELTPRRLTLAYLEPFAVESAVWLERLDRAVESRKTALEAEAALVTKSKAAELGKQAFTAKSAEVNQIQGRVEELQGQSDIARTRAEAFDGEGIAHRREAAGQKKTALESFEKALVHLGNLFAQEADLREELRELQGTQAKEALEQDFLRQTRIPAAEASAVAARRAYELAAAAVEDAALKYRGLLVEGKECPVCGSTSHPFAQHLSDAALRTLKEDWEGKDRAFNRETAQALALDSAGVSRQAQIKQKSQTAGEWEVRLRKGREITTQHAETCGLAQVPETARLEAVTAQLEQLAATLKALNQEDAERREAEKRHSDARSQFEKARQTAETLEAELARLRTAQALADSARDHVATESAKARLVSEAAAQAVQPLLSIVPEARRDQLAAHFAQLAGLDRRLRELAETLRVLEVELSPLLVQITEADDALNKRRTAETSAREAHTQVRTKRATLIGGRAADEVEAELELAAKLARETAHKVQQELAHLRAAQAGAAAARLGAGELFRQRAEIAAAATATLDRWLGDFTLRHDRFLARPELEQMLARDRSFLQTEREALDALDQAITHVRGTLAAHQDNLDAHAASRPTEETEEEITIDLAAKYTVRAAAAERLSAARTEIALDDARLAQSAELTSELAAAQTALRPWQDLNDLIGSADGAKFRTIAQGRTLDILLSYANAQLTQLSARYSLQHLRDSLNLIVIDRDMGDERRSVHSLSGGESFLVSLALALGLASLTSNRLRIESLFIDEGFGSLDPETLTIALNALTQLESQGRKVGVISHVAELAEAIPVQIRVVKGRSGASRLQLPDSPALAPE